MKGVGEKICKNESKNMKVKKISINGANRYKNEFDAERETKSAHSKPNVIINSNDKGLSEHEGCEKRTAWEEFDDNSQNLVTRSSTWSIPISESSKFKSKINTSAKSKAKKASAIDMPLQRNNIEIKCANVSPIIEDDKEETIDEESKLRTPSWNNLFNEYINSEFKSIKDVKSTNSTFISYIFIANNIKQFRPDAIVNELANQLFSSIKIQFIKENQKFTKTMKGLNNKENQHKNSIIQPKSIKQRKSTETIRPKKSKITDVIKIKMTTKDGKLTFHEANKKNKAIEEIIKPSPPSTEQSTEDLQEKRRKKIGWEFLKYKPKKINRKPKTKRRRVEKKEVCLNTELIMRIAPYSRDKIKRTHMSN